MHKQAYLEGYLQKEAGRGMQVSRLVGKAMRSPKGGAYKESLRLGKNIPYAKAILERLRGSADEVLKMPVRNSEGAIDIANLARLLKGTLKGREASRISTTKMPWASY